MGLMGWMPDLRVVACLWRDKKDCGCPPLVGPDTLAPKDEADRILSSAAFLCNVALCVMQRLVSRIGLKLIETYKIVYGNCHKTFFHLTESF